MRILKRHKVIEKLQIRWTWREREESGKGERRERNRLTARTDKTYPFCLCQDEARKVRDFPSQEMKSQQKKNGEKESERQWTTETDKGGNQPENCGQSNDHMVFR